VKKAKSKRQPKELIESFGLKSGLFNSISIKPFGKDSSSPFEIDIIINSSSFKIANVGYGISQVLPIIVEKLARSKNTVFAIQQPEVHLHPKAQAALGDFIYFANQNTNMIFFIETHSEYLINRFRLNVHRNKEKKSKSQVLFFERTENGNKVHTIEIEGDGKYSEDQPASFKDFFIKEEIDLLDI
jgi:predicted ATPase